LQQVAEHFGGCFVVQRIGSAAVMVERNAEAVESIADEGVVAVYQFLRLPQMKITSSPRSLRQRT